MGQINTRKATSALFLIALIVFLRIMDHLIVKNRRQRVGLHSSQAEARVSFINLILHRIVVINLNSNLYPNRSISPDHHQDHYQVHLPGPIPRSISQDHCQVHFLGLFPRSISQVHHQVHQIERTIIERSGTIIERSGTILVRRTIFQDHNCK